MNNFSKRIKNYFNKTKKKLNSRNSRKIFDDLHEELFIKRYG